MTETELQKRAALIRPVDYLDHGRRLCLLQEERNEDRRAAMWSEMADTDRVLQFDIAEVNGPGNSIRDHLISFPLSTEDRETAVRVVCVAGHWQITTPHPPTISQVAHGVNYQGGSAGFLACRKVISTLCVKSVFVLEKNAGAVTDPHLYMHPSMLEFLTGGPPLHAEARAASSGQPQKAAKESAASVTSARALFEMTRKRVVGLDPIVRAVCSRVVMHRDRVALLQKGANPSAVGATQAVLLVGSSGSGKTWMMQSISEICGLPFSLFDSTAITEEGYVGLSVSDAVHSLIEAAGKDADAARYGILCFDEWDSRAGNRTGTRDIAGAVQKAVLRLMEGCLFPVGGRRSGANDKPVTFDSRGTMFAFAGAYAGLEEILQRRARRKSGIGFADASAQRMNPDSDLYEGLLEYGCAPEFLNRITKIIVFPKPTLEQLVAIATSRHGPIAKVNAGLANRLTLDFDDDAVRLMAIDAFESKRYSRGITSLVQTVAEAMVFAGVRGRQVVIAEDVQSVIDSIHAGAACLTATGNFMSGQG